jgi:hypothetical protein
MQSKSLLIAIAAFAVTATGAQAYIGNEQLNRAGFSLTQIEALNEARELKSKGETEKARDVLLEAGVDEDKLDNLRKVSHNSHYRIHKAVIEDNYNDFKVAIEGTPLADIITTKDDFEYFRQAHYLRQKGDLAEAKAIFEDLGISNVSKVGFGGGRYHERHMLDLTEEQRDALRVAQQANDQDTVDAILIEAGVNYGGMHHMMGGRW